MLDCVWVAALKYLAMQLWIIYLAISCYGFLTHKNMIITVSLKNYENSVSQSPHTKNSIELLDSQEINLTVSYSFIIIIIIVTSHFLSQHITHRKKTAVKRCVSQL